MTSTTNFSVKLPEGQDTPSDSVTKQPEKKLNLFPVSFSQQQMWVLDQLSPGTSTYTISEALHLQGHLNFAALQAALQELTNRHEALRTIFPSVAGRPLQLVQAPAPLNLLVEDISAWPARERASHLMQRLQAEATRPFHLASGPLFRTRLFRSQEQDHVLLISTHHIIFDGWSLGVLLNDLAQLYTAFVAGYPSPLAPLSTHYTDFARWQRAWLQSPAFEEQLAFWKARLHEPLLVLDLPTDRPHPLTQSFVGAQYSFSLPHSLTLALRQISQQAGTTLFTTLLTAWKIVLSRYSGQTDICIGIPVANRTRPEVEGLIGCFINTLTVRSDLSGNPEFLHILRQISQGLLDGYAHQDLPFEKLVEELHPKRSMNIHPLFQSMFLLQNGPQSLLHLSGLEVRPLPLPVTTAKLDLTCFLWERDNGLEGCIEYNTDLFDESTIRRLFNYYQTLLENIAVDPNRKLSQLSLISAQEQQKMLVEWNATSVEYDRQCCIQTLIEAQAARTPGKIAVVFEDSQLSYHELNARSNQFARYLQALGVGPEVLVAICIERSLDMLTALLGILKAGGAYLPLDPSYPAERINFMLDDAQATVLVTQQSFVATGTIEPASIVSTRVVCIDTDQDKFIELSKANLTTPVTSSHLAYVIYTSGSTGRPKGVQISHRALVNFLLSMHKEPGISPHDTLLAVTTLSFDIAGLELYLPLIVGARLVIASRAVAADGHALAEMLAHIQEDQTDQAMTIMQATPITWRILLATGWQAHASLKVFCGGEALPLELARQLMAHGASLYNMYGPTETTIYSTIQKLTPTDTSISIGRPIANTTLYILDQHLQLVPIGISGELYIGGDGLARGYLNRPQFTEERFIQHPFHSDPTMRLYRTGDLARYRPDGTVELIGRIDHQIKLRGFRIELGEIETILRTHPKVHEAVVLVREDIPGDKRLVAYLVPPNEESPTMEELRHFLGTRLPGHMLPAAYIQLSALPLTSNGKLDRKALPPPGEERPAMEIAYVAPRTPDEEAIARIWGRVLGLDRVGIHDNFFDLGGHSFSAVRLMYEIEKAIGRYIPAGTIFQAPTVEQLALFVSDAGSVISSSASSLLPLRPAGSGHPLLFIHPIGGNVLCYSDLIQHLNTDSPVYGLAAAGLHTQTPPDTSIPAMAQRYVQMLIASTLPEPYLLLGWSMGGIIALEMAQVLRRQWNKMAHVLLLDSHIDSLGADGEWDDAALVAGFAEDWGQTIGQDLALHETALRRLTPDQMTTHLLTKAAAAGAIPPGTDAAYIQRLLEVFKANAFALRAYHLATSHTGKLALFHAMNTPQSLNAPICDWSAWAKDTVEVTTIPGDHYGMMKEPHVTHLAHAIEQRLATWGF